MCVEKGMKSWFDSFLIYLSLSIYSKNIEKSSKIPNQVPIAALNVCAPFPIRNSL